MKQVTAEECQEYAFRDRGANMKYFPYVLLAVLIFLPACSAAQPPDQDRLAAIKATQAQEQCLDEEKTALGKALAGSPKFTSIQQAVTWANKRIPTDYQEAIKASGADLSNEINPTTVQEYASSHRQELWKLLVKVTFLRIRNMPSHLHDNCGSGTEDVLKNILDVKLGLSEQPLSGEFEQLGLHDTYHYDHVFLYMMVLDSSGLKWNKDWFLNFEPL